MKSEVCEDLEKQLKLLITVYNEENGENLILETYSGSLLVMNGEREKVAEIWVYENKITSSTDNSKPGKIINDFLKEYQMI